MCHALMLKLLYATMISINSVVQFRNDSLVATSSLSMSLLGSSYLLLPRQSEIMEKIEGIIKSKPEPASTYGR